MIAKCQPIVTNFVQDLNNFDKVIYILQNTENKSTLFITTELLTKTHLQTGKIGPSEISKIHF